MMKNNFLILLLFTPLIAVGQVKMDFKGYQFNWSGDYVKDKNFYFLSLLEQIPLVKDELIQHDGLQQFLQLQKEELKIINRKCSLDISCYATAFKWQPEQIEKVGVILAGMSDLPAIQVLLNQHLKPSGTYQRHASQHNADFIRSAWKDCAMGINQVIDVYALAGAQRYPNIDSSSYDVNSNYYRRLVESMVETMGDDTSAYDLFFQPSLQLALNLLDINNRDEAARFEPMTQGENQAAYQSITRINWERFPYSVILVPGHGPDEPKVSLSPFAKLRNRLAADRYHKGLAPLIIVSGGYVHPFQTEYCEALEMKKDLMEKHQVPEEAIILEPHARHTTTNFRNAARIIYRYGIPASKLAICTTTKGQSYYISEMNLAQRCQQELGYVPYKLGKRLSIHDLEWLPQATALSIDPVDPLDP